MKNKILIIITFLAGTLLFNSCLKDKYGEDWTSALQGKMYAEISNSGKQSFTIAPNPTDQDLKFLINIATDALPTADITLTVAIDASAMTAYNKDTVLNSSKTQFALYPTLTIVNPTITIKAGTRNNYVHVTLKGADKISLTTPWMVPITITTASSGVVIADNKKSVLISLPIANQWEGKYKMLTGSTFMDVLNPTFTLIIPANFALETTGAHTVKVKDLGLVPTAGGYGRAVLSAPGSSTYYGSFCAEYEIDPITNKVIAVRNTYGQPASNTRSAALDPSGVNTYNPVTKTIDVSYFCLQTSTVPVGPRLKFRDILQYTGSL